MEDSLIQFCKVTSSGINGGENIGRIVLGVKKKEIEYQKFVQLKGEAIYYTNYHDINNFKLELSELDRNDSIQDMEIIGNSIPITCFEDINFNLGKQEKVVENYGMSLKMTRYTVPIDLKVLVIESEKGNYWKKKSSQIGGRNLRPPILTRWAYAFLLLLLLSMEYLC